MLEPDSLIGRLGTWQDMTLGEVLGALTNPALLAKVTALVIAILATRMLMRSGAPSAIPFLWPAPEVGSYLSLVVNPADV
jgi:hypothetical protein